MRGFVISLDRVVIAIDDSSGALLCVQGFVRSRRFTQRIFFSDSEIAMLTESAAISDKITTTAVYGIWSHLETTPHSQVVAEVCACVNRAVDRQRTVKDSQEQ